MELLAQSGLWPEEGEGREEAVGGGGGRSPDRERGNNGAKGGQGEVRSGGEQRRASWRGDWKRRGRVGARRGEAGGGKKPAGKRRKMGER